MDLVGAVGVAGAPGAGDDGRVAGELLAGGAAGEDFQHHTEIPEAGNDSLHAHHGDVDPRRRCGQPAVALVGHERNRAALRNGEVDPTDADICAEKEATKVGARRRVQFSRIVGEVDAEAPAEELSDLGARLVHDRSDDV